MTGSSILVQSLRTVMKTSTSQAAPIPTPTGFMVKMAAFLPPNIPPQKPAMPVMMRSCKADLALFSYQTKSCRRGKDITNFCVAITSCVKEATHQNIELEQGQESVDEQKCVLLALAILCPQVTGNFAVHPPPKLPVTSNSHAEVQCQEE